MKNKITQKIECEMTFDVIRTETMTIISLGQLKYELIEQQPRQFVLMTPHKGKVQQYEGRYPNILRKALDYILNDIVSNLRYKFNMEVTK